MGLFEKLNFSKSTRKKQQKEDEREEQLIAAVQKAMDQGFGGPRSTWCAERTTKDMNSPEWLVEGLWRKVLIENGKGEIPWGYDIHPRFA